MDCVFCKIAHGEIPSKKAYEDDQVFAFYDLDPQAPVHILIVPKEHIASTMDLTPENSAIVAHIFEVAVKLAKELHLEKGLRADRHSNPIFNKKGLYLLWRKLIR